MTLEKEDTCYHQQENSSFLVIQRLVGLNIDGQVGCQSQSLSSNLGFATSCERPEYIGIFRSLDYSN